MTTPPAPPAPSTGPTGQPPGGAPPQQQPPPPPPHPDGQPHPGQPAPAPAPADDLTELRASMEAERRRSKELERQLATLQQAHMSDEERRLAQARAEGKAEAEAAAAELLAAAEFRHLATGRIHDADGALEYIDLKKLVKDGAPNKRAITAAVDRLAAQQQQGPPQPAGRVPAGVLGNGQDTQQDWLGSTLRGPR